MGNKRIALGDALTFIHISFREAGHPCETHIANNYGSYFLNITYRIFNCPIPARAAIGERWNDKNQDFV